MLFLLQDFVGLGLFGYMVKKILFLTTLFLYIGGLCKSHASTEDIAISEGPYQISVSAEGHGSVTVSKTSVPPNSVVSVTATPENGYKLKEWVTSSKSCVTDKPMSVVPNFTIGDNCEIKAIFVAATIIPITEEPAQYTIAENYYSGIVTNEVRFSLTAPEDQRYKIRFSSDYTSPTIRHYATQSFTSGTIFSKDYTKALKKGDIEYFGFYATTSPYSAYLTKKITVYYEKASLLTVKANSNGSVTSSANFLFEGENSKITAVADSGYKFSNWKITSGTCSVADENSKSTTVTMGKDDCVVTGVFEPKVIYPITSSPQEYTVTQNFYDDASNKTYVWFSITASKDGLYLITTSTENAKLTFYDVFPEDGSKNHYYSSTKRYAILSKGETKFIGIYSSNTSTPFTIKADHVPLVISSDENGSAKITSREPYNTYDGEKVYYEAIPNTGYTLKNWEVIQGPCINHKSSLTSYTIHRESCEIKANFEKIFQLDISNNGHGTSTESQTVRESRTLIAITADADSGYKLQKWTSSSEVCLITDTLAISTTVSVQGNCEIKAVFAKAKIIPITETPTEYNIAKDYYSVNAKKEIRFSFTAPNDGYYSIKNGQALYNTQKYSDSAFTVVSDQSPYISTYWFTKGESVYLKTSIYDNKPITISYAKIPSLTISSSENGSVTPDTTRPGFTGSKYPITATANNGFKFNKWEIKEGSCTIENIYSKSSSITMGEDKCTVVAIFIPGTIHQLTTNPVEYVNTEDYYDDAHGNAVWFKLTAADEGLYSITVTRDDITTFSLYEIDPFSSNQNITITLSSGSAKTLYSSFSKGETKYFRFYDSRSSAHFSINYEYIPFIISASNGGTIEITSRNAISTGERINIKAIPDSNFMVTIQTISGTCQKYSPVNNIYTIDYNSACEVKFNFKREYYDLTFVQNGNGTTEESQKIRASANSMYIHAVPDDGNAFRKWTSSSELCVIDAPTAATSKITVNDDCTITAYFEKTFQLTISNNGNGSTSPSTETVAESSPEVKISATANEEYKFKQWTSSSEGCVIENQFFAETIVNVGDDCNIEAEFAPAEVYVLTETATTYNYNEHFYGLSTVSLDYSAIRYNFAFPDTGWYYIQIDYVDNLNAILYDFGSDISFETLQKTDSIINPKRFFIKGDEKDHYWAIRDSLDNHPDKSFNIKIDKATYSIVTIQTGRQGSGDPVGNISVLQGYDTVITARPYIGYIFDKWIDSDNCMSIETPNSATSHVFAKSDSCSIQATYTIDPSIVPIVTVNRIDSSEAPKFQASISITDSATGKSLNGIDYGSFTISVDGKPISFDANSIQKNINGNMEEEYFITFEIQDSIMNGDDHDITIAVAFGSRTSKNSSKLTEPLWVAKDVVDSFKLYGLNSDSSKINRSTDKIKITLTSQNFTSGKDSAKVTITCKNSRDIETLLLQEKKDGLFEATIEKDERPGKKNDKKLSCSIADTIIVEYTDPVYQIVSRDTVVFADSIHNTYEFLDEQLKTELDSVEDYETTFGFRVTALSPTLYEADTIKVLMFTNAGDSAWFDAVETGAYTSTFEGIGNFKYVATQSEMFKDSLDATLNLDSTITRIKIQAQVDNDNSKLNKRDSLIVTSTFIPADSAELYDRDLDGRADFVRIHFASSIAQEDIFVKGAQNISKTKDFSWIEAELKEPYEYGYTVFNKDSIPFVLVSRASSNIVQKVALTDRTGAVPLIANKISGVVASDGYLGEEKKNQPDTLLITMSEVVHYDSSSKSYMDLFYYSETCDSENIKEIHLLEEPIVDSTELVWTLILNPEAILKTGFCIKTNNKSPYKDVNDNSNGIGGVVITGDNGKQYLYEIVANPSVSGIGKRARWISPESGEWEDVPDTISCLKTETRFAYTADILIFDAQGHYITTLKQEFGKHGELEDSRRENEHNETKYAYLYWNQRSSEGNIVGTGVYIWKIKFTFADGHKESRTIRTGVRRTR